MSEKRLDPRELPERFLAAYNAVQKALSDVLDIDPHTAMFTLIDDYSHNHRRWGRGDGAWLRRVAPLRNALVHDRTRPRGFLAIPMPSVVQRLERIRDSLIAPEMAIPTFQGPVVRLNAGATVAEALARVRKEDYSQFPVYDGQRFVGLLTENGITRWLARHLHDNDCTLADMADITVGQVLAFEAQRKNHMFIARDALVDDLLEAFVDSPMLEAVLITQHGRKREKLLGIATRSDLLRELDD